MLRANNTLSPHLVSTLCRLRFVPTLCPYALSNAKAGAAEVHQTRPIVLVLEPRNCRHCRYCRYCRYCRRAGQASACPRTRGRVDARPSRGCDPGALSGARRAASRDGVAPPVLARLCRSCPTQCGADIPVCAVDSDHTVARNLEGKSAALPFCCPVAETTCLLIGLQPEGVKEYLVWQATRTQESSSRHEARKLRPRKS